MLIQQLIAPWADKSLYKPKIASTFHHTTTFSTIYVNVQLHIWSVTGRGVSASTSNFSSTTFHLLHPPRRRWRRSKKVPRAPATGACLNHSRRNSNVSELKWPGEDQAALTATRRTLSRQLQPVWHRPSTTGTGEPRPSILLSERIGALQA